MADRLGNGLQNRVEQFDSARYLQRQGHGFKACVLFAFKQYACPYCFLLFAFLFFAVSLKNINFAVKAAGGRWHLRQLLAHARTLNITYGNK